MIYEELLTEFQNNWGGHTTLELKYRNVIRAVVELHKPEKCGDCCITCDGGYPCPTIQAIEKELR